MTISYHKIRKGLCWTLAGMAIFSFLSFVPTTSSLDTHRYSPYYYLIAGGIFGIAIFSLRNRISFQDRLYYGTYTLMRYLLGYHLVVSAYLKIESKYWQLAYSKLDSPLIDLSSFDIYQGFFGHSTGYQVSIGVVQLIAATLLFFRKTALIAAIFLFFFLGNAFAIFYFYDLGNLRYPAIYLFINITILLFQWDILKALWYRETNIQATHPLIGNINLYQSLNILKLILITGPLVMYLWTVEKYPHHAQNKTQAHPIKGTWIVESIDIPNESADKDTLELRLFEKIYIENNVWGYARVGDTSSYFKYVLDTSYNQFELYGFEGFRSWDIKGRYEFEEGRLIYKARNNKHPFTMTLLRDERFEKLMAGQTKRLSRRYDLSPINTLKYKDQ